MALITALLGMLGRFTGKVLTTTLGWASVILFGRIPESRQVRFAMLTFGSLVWVGTAIGIVIPKVAVFLISLVPLPDWVDDNVVRFGMIVAALALPAVLGGVAMSVSDPADRPSGAAMVGGLLRGYLLAPTLALTLVVLAVAGIARKVSAMLKKRTTGHVPIVVRPGRYEALVDQLDEILRTADLVTWRRDGSRMLTIPARALAGVAGTGIRKMVPDHLAVLTGPEVELEVYPSDLSISGSRLGLARARAAVLRDLDSVNCWMTTAATAQEIEDRLAKIDRSSASWDPKVIDDVDHRLASEAIDDDEWDVLYRRRLQVAAEATSTNLGDRVHGAAAAPRGRPDTDRPEAGTLVGLVTAALVVADILLLARRGRDGRR
jgi:hypothetical protein